MSQVEIQPQTHYMRTISSPLVTTIIKTDKIVNYHSHEKVMHNGE